MCVQVTNYVKYESHITNTINHVFESNSNEEHTHVNLVQHIYDTFTKKDTTSETSSFTYIVNTIGAEHTPINPCGAQI